MQDLGHQQQQAEDSSGRHFSRVTQRKPGTYRVVLPVKSQNKNQDKTQNATTSDTTTACPSHNANTNDARPGKASPANNTTQRNTKHGAVSDDRTTNRDGKATARTMPQYTMFSMGACHVELTGCRLVSLMTLATEAEYWDYIKTPTTSNNKQHASLTENTTHNTHGAATHNICNGSPQTHGTSWLCRHRRPR